MRGTPASTRLRALFAVPVVAGLIAALGAATTTACSDGYCTNATESYQVFQPNTPVSAIPLCKASGIQGPFAGAPPLSATALAQCSAICPISGFFPEGGGTAPCCLSEWEARTVVCAPPCTP